MYFNALKSCESDQFSRRGAEMHRQRMPVGSTRLKTAIEPAEKVAKLEVPNGKPLELIVSALARESASTAVLLWLVGTEGTEEMQQQETNKCACGSAPRSIGQLCPQCRAEWHAWHEEDMKAVALAAAYDVPALTEAAA